MVLLYFSPGILKLPGQVKGSCIMTSHGSIQCKEFAAAKSIQWIRLYSPQVVRKYNRPRAAERLESLKFTTPLYNVNANKRIPLKSIIVWRRQTIQNNHFHHLWPWRIFIWWVYANNSKLLTALRLPIPNQRIVILVQGPCPVPR